MLTGKQRARAKIAAFSEAGLRLGLEIAKCTALDATAERVKSGGLAAWASSAWEGGFEALIFVSSAGIAVRAIAPLVKSKASDPAVIAIDEAGQFAVSLLSGHMGGANRLAREIGEYIGAMPVITTATDARGLFAVDQWASEMGFAVENPAMIKKVSSEILAGNTVGFESEVPIGGQAPGCLTGAQASANIYIGDSAPDLASALWLRPRPYAIGVGCRKGAGIESVEQAVKDCLHSEGISIKSAFALASIDLKKGERALIELAAKHSMAFITYSAAELMQVKGDSLASSEFVLKTTGADNVCERAALCACGENAQLISPRTAGKGVTVALAKSTKEYFFD